MSHAKRTVKLPGYYHRKVRVENTADDGVYVEVNGCVKFVEKFGFGCQGRFSHAIKPVSFL